MGMRPYCREKRACASADLGCDRVLFGVSTRPSCRWFGRLCYDEVFLIPEIGNIFFVALITFLGWNKQECDATQDVGNEANPENDLAKERHRAQKPAVGDKQEQECPAKPTEQANEEGNHALRADTLQLLSVQ